MRTTFFFFLFLATAPLLSAQPTLPIKAMSYNIRFDNPNDGADAWPQRKDVLINQIRFYGPDVIGMQEVLKSQLDTLADRLPHYAWVGVGRDDGEAAGEFSPIFYREERFTALQAGTFWLSPTPAKVSKGWDAALPRICTYVQLRERETDRIFWFFNTHFDHVGVTARTESIKVIKAQIAERNTGDDPVIISGDFNVQPQDAPMRIMRQDFADAWQHSNIPPYGPTGTFNGFQADHPLDRRIDYLYYSPDDWQVLRVAHLSTLRDGHYPSDHLPVFAEFLWKS